MSPYTFLEDVAIADVAFEATGRDPAALFEACAAATFAVMVDPATVEPRIAREVSLREAAPDRLLFDFLAELIYLKDAEALVFARFEVEVGREEGGGWAVWARATGDRIDPERMALGADVKAVTYHLFELREAGEGWWARVVLDI